LGRATPSTRQPSRTRTLYSLDWLWACILNVRR